MECAGRRSPRFLIMENEKKNYKKGKSCDSRTNSKGPQNSDKKFKKYDKTDKGLRFAKENDVSWYSKIGEQLLKDTASIPMTYPLGNILDLGEYGGAAWGSTINTTSFPGVAAIDWMPSFGYSDNPNSPINVAARQVYSWVRHANSGHANYDSPDLMIYLMAVDQVNMWLEYMKRLYGVAMTYNNQNRYYPNTILYANFMNYEDVYGRLAELRAKINVYAAKAQALCIPNTITIYDRHKWMSSGLFLDTMDTIKAQTYFYVPALYYTFGLDGDKAGMLVPHGWGYLPTTGEVVNTTGHTLDDVYAVMDSILDPLLASEDFGIMGGDILKAYGEGNMFKFMGIDESYSVFPSYHQDVIDQIHNCTLISSIKYPTLEQDTNKQYLVSKPMGRIHSLHIEAGRNYGFMNRIVDFHRDGVGPKDVMVATRLMNILDPTISEGVGGSALYGITTAGTEIAHSMRVFRLAKESDGYVGPQFRVINAVNQFNANLPDNTDDGKKKLSSTLNNVVQEMAALSVFDNHPQVTFNIAIEGVVSNIGNNIVADFGNYGFLDIQTLKNITEIALLSEFNAI
nr:putative capsid [Marmot picobirnavirus]